MKTKRTIIFIIIVASFVMLSGCSPIRKSPPSLEAFEDGIKTEYKFVKYILCQSGTPVNINFSCRLSELREADELQDLTEKLKGYATSDTTFDELAQTGDYYEKNDVQYVRIWIYYEKNGKTTVIVDQYTNAANEWINWDEWE